MIGLLTPEAVNPRLKAQSKKQALLAVAKLMAGLTGQSERAICDVLLERERLGTTGMGRGIAIPHGKLETLDRVYGGFFRLPDPIDFDALDDQPVDLMFVLLAPEEAKADHLKALARVTRVLRNERLCQMLRGCDDADGLVALLSEGENRSAA